MRKSNETIEQHAIDFLQQYNSDDTIPVPIEQIVELALGITIVPIKELLRQHHVDGFLSHDCQTIYIDEDNYMSQANRARFTLAHEVGHLFMHRHIIENIKTLEAWKSHILGAGTGRAIYETEANIFAGCVLMPSTKVLDAYQEAQKKVIISFKELKLTVPDHNKIIPYVASEVAKLFDVSDQAAEIRLKNIVKSMF